MLDCEPFLYIAISGPGMADSSVWPCGVMSLADSLVASPLGFTAYFSLISGLRKRKRRLAVYRYTKNLSSLL